MKRLLVLSAAIAVVAAISTGAAAGETLFPADVLSAGGGAGFAAKLGEPPIWRPASAVYDRQIRLFIGGHTIQSWVIRLDQTRTDRWTGHVREHDGRRLLPARSFSVSQKDIGELQSLVARAQLWESHPQFYLFDEPDEVCIDGMTLILERRDSTGYRYAEGNAQCTMGAAQLAVAAKLIAIAGRPGLQALLR